MIRLYFLQAFYHLRENPIITWVSVLGTAMAICMIMVLVITFQVRLVDCEPEVNRSRTLYVPYMSVKQKVDQIMSPLILPCPCVRVANVSVH